MTLVGEVAIGVRLVSRSSPRTTIRACSVLLLAPIRGRARRGSHRGASIWALSDDEAEGQFFTVYILKDGGVIDQAPPPSLSGVQAQIAVYDRDANGNYIVDGCEVLALGKVGDDQLFAINAGTANVQGFKRIRESSIRHAEEESPELESIAAEPHTFTGATLGTTIVAVSRAPIDTVTAVIIVKRTSETITRGNVAGGTDPLGHSSVVAIESIVQGTTISSSAYALAGDSVSWAPAGTEPAAFSTYTVTYLYNAAVTPDAVRIQPFR